ncbi:peptidoglycan DD-metalloendopeptidase family protein [Oscillospiraceae bacterium WX1]
MTIFLVLALTVIMLNSQVGFAVYFRGEKIGNVKSMAVVTAAVTGAENQLEEIYGHDYSLDKAISVTANVGGGTVNQERVQDGILGGIDGLVKLYVLEVNGTAVGASADEATLDGVLNDILKTYATEQTSSVRFAETVNISHRFINEDITQDAAAIKAAIDPKNEAAAHRLTVESTEQTQRIEEIPFDVEYYSDDTVYEGNLKVKSPGVCGENVITENSVYLNGVLQSCQMISTVKTKDPVTERVAVGTAPRPKTASYDKYIWPAEGVITSGFGPRTGFGSANHQGIDIAGASGSDIVAADGGEVILADWYFGYGLMVQIRHDNGDITYYGHCSELLVSKGERVYQGQTIAYMGETGEASGVHCHFEIRVNGVPVNPIAYLP